MGSFLADGEQRRKALDPHHSFIVQAPAGAGKTELLTQRYLVLLAGVAAPEEVLAITFTRKAATEMRNRIVQALQRAGDPTPPEQPHEALTWRLARAVREQDQALGWELEQTPSRLKIQTIDSLCAQLTRQMPVLSSFGAAPGIRENATELYREAARNTLAELDNSRWTEPLSILLRHLDGDIKQFEELLLDMLGRRDQWLRHVLRPDDHGQWREVLEAGLERIVTRALVQLNGFFDASRAQELVALLQYAAANLEREGESFLDPCRGWEQLPEPGPEGLPFWRGVCRFLLTDKNQWRKSVTKTLGFPAPSGVAAPHKAAAAEYKQRWQDLVQELADEEGLLETLELVRGLPEGGYSEAQWDVLQSLLAVLKLATAQLMLVFQGAGEVDFIEIGMQARHALGGPQEPTDLALSLDYRIQHILMDEFQDTSVTQFELLQRLVAGWQPGDGRTFFGVGDPMQSIYRFREAEVGLFLQAAQEGIGDVPLEPLVLSVNFRSQAGVVDWVNAVFPQVLPPQAEAMTGAVPYSPSQSIRPQSPAQAVHIHPQLEADTAAEAEAVVACIHSSLETAPEHERIAVLARAAKHLVPIVQRLRREQIPFQAVDIDPVAEKPVVSDLLALTRALARPADRLAWLAVLRAPWCGLDRGDLAAIAKHGGEVIWEAIAAAVTQKGLSAGGQKRLQRVYEGLKPVLEYREQIAFYRRLEMAWHAMGGPACLTDQDDQEAALVFFELVRHLSAGGATPSPEEVQQGVDTLRARPEPEGAARVQLMTIHKAKGLEFETVLVPGLGRGHPAPERRLLMWQEVPREQGGEDLLLAPVPPTGGQREATYRYIQQLEQTKSALEEGRVLYVAATRARERLHLFGHAKRYANGALGAPPGSLLALLWPQVADTFEACPEPENDHEPDQAGQDNGYWLRRLPEDWCLPEIPAAVGARAQELESREQPERPEFDWAGRTVRRIGTVVHRWLMRWAQQPPQNRDGDFLAPYRESFRRDLLSEGVGGEELAAAVSRVEEALGRVLSDERGLWLLAAHPEARCEYPLTGILEGKLSSVVLDRTFVDDHGQRWIVDYKVGRHSGTDREAFLDREQERYRSQLEHYARLMALWEERPIRLGLYFPLIQGWREWAWSEPAQEAGDTRQAPSPAR
ncbi:MAG: UvrD-helicase domain-containing protein [Thermodesulfobacteriota bacterium]